MPIDNEEDSGLLKLYRRFMHSINHKSRVDTLCMKFVKEFYSIEYDPLKALDLATPLLDKMEDLRTDTIVANVKTAISFYLSDTPQMEEKDLFNHIKGIDFEQNVAVKTLDIGTTLNQMQRGGFAQGNIRRGQYYALDSSSAVQRGIAPETRESLYPSDSTYQPPVTSGTDVTSNPSVAPSEAASETLTLLKSLLSGSSPSSRSVSSQQTMLLNDSLSSFPPHLSSTGSSLSSIVFLDSPSRGHDSNWNNIFLNLEDHLNLVSPDHQIHPQGHNQYDSLADHLSPHDLERSESSSSEHHLELLEYYLPKEMTNYCVRERVQSLVSIAKPIDDNWSDPKASFVASGGGTQLYIRKCDNGKIISDHELKYKEIIAKGGVLNDEDMTVVIKHIVILRAKAMFYVKVNDSTTVNNILEDLRSLGGNPKISDPSVKELAEHAEELITSAQQTQIASNTVSSPPNLS